ncbi:disease resistance protein RPP2B-like isoform X2 [Ziziphus jujuba]|uniref:Disease resistance protein RPP2B-like isoform X2 n=1 Tax=Ziziphus jujuba TaxID=326968 RepID=A0ABM3IE17_ZIZJJ|nr:disease resistance protein RPP2B-like isoform X2 [Ziziphus jujuba]
MHNLRLLKIYNQNPRWCIIDGTFQDAINMRETYFGSLNLPSSKIYVQKTGCVIDKQCKVCLPHGLEYLPDALRYLYWEEYPLTSLPSKFSPENLVELTMTHSWLKQLWDGVQNLGNLRKIDLRYSQHLTEIPNLSLASNLESINLKRCASLLELASHFGYLNKVSYLNVRYCSNLKILSKIPQNIKYLDLRGTAVAELPPSFLCLYKLADLYPGKPTTCHCNFAGSTFNPNSLESLDTSTSYIRALPTTIKQLPSLIVLDLEGCINISWLKSLKSSLTIVKCSKLEKLVGKLESVECMRFLHLGPAPKKLLPSIDMIRQLQKSSGASYKDFGHNIYGQLTHLTPNVKLPLDQHMMSTLKSLQILDLSYCNIEFITTSIKRLYNLYRLDIRCCKSLKYLPDQLPSTLQQLEASGCTSLEKVPSLSHAVKRCWNQNKAREKKLSEDFIFLNCPKLDQNSKNNIIEDALLRLLRQAALADIPTANKYHPHGSARVNVCCPGSEIPMWSNYQTLGTSTTIKLPPDWSDAELLGFAVCAVVEFEMFFSDEECSPSTSTSPCDNRILKSSYLFQWLEPTYFNGTVTEVRYSMHPVQIEDRYIELCNVKRYGIRPLSAQDAKNVFNLNQHNDDDDDEEEDQSHFKRLSQ